MRRPLFSTLPFFLGFLGLVACGTLAGNPEEDDDDKDPPKAVVTAPVTFSITDAPLDDAKSVLITVTSVAVHLEEGDGEEGWVEIPLKQAAAIDLLQLQDGASAALAALPELPVGTYKQTRLMLSETAPPQIVLADGTVEELKIPSGAHTGLKIKTPFTVEEGKPLALTIDFDLRKSVKKVGGKKNERYQMKPFLRLVADAGTGSITGLSPTGKTVCVYPTGAAKDLNDECETSANSAKVKNGTFKLAFLAPGSYETRVFDAEGKPAGDGQAITVDAGKAADAGTLP